MRIRRRIKRTTKQYIIVAIICILVIGGAAALTSFVLTSQIKEEYKQLLAEVKREKEVNQRNVYVATSDIRTGDTISTENVEPITAYASQPVETYITDDGFGMVAMVDIPSGTHIQRSMLTEHTVASELRELEYDVINIGSNITTNDTVDVRIFYPNGESYIVLSKKLLKGYTPDTVNLTLWLDEEELLRMSAAIVDAGLYPGSRLYVTKYIEPRIQEASIVTYAASLSILSLIEHDPNIVARCSQELNKEVRKALENRLAASMDTDVSSISWEVNPNNFVASLPVTETRVEASEQEDKLKQAEDVDYGSNSDFLYYAQEEEAKDGDMEYGE